MKSRTFAAILFVLLLAPTIASAHPIDELGVIKAYDQSQTLEIGNGNATLTIDLTFYALDKMQVWESIDKNRNKEASEQEKATWMVKGQDASWLEINGRRVSFSASSLSLPSYYDFFSYQPTKVKIEFEASGPWSEGEHMAYHYEGKDKKLNEISLVVQGGERVTKRSDNTVEFTVEPFGGSVLGVTSSGKVNAFLDRYVKGGVLPFRFIVLALATAFVLGAVHALTPGHGKAMVASFLVGEKGTIVHAINLGLIITVTHTASVFLLGAAALLFTQYVVPGTIVKALNLISGLLIVTFGVLLLIKRTWKALKKHKHGAYVHAHEHTHEHGREHVHEHGQSTISWKNLLALGISGGIVPCVDALAILVVAVSVHKILLGLMVLVAFSIGLATALISAGLVAVIAKGAVSKRYAHLHNYEQYLGIISALVVTCLGIGLLLNVRI